jgi:regulatory protein YycH of two-component signal transduction system YycFG
MLKDTASGAHQHPLRTYKGTANTAEGDGSRQVLKYITVNHISITSDGDAAIHRIVACEYDSSEVVTYRDPNHYAKSLEKDFGGLSVF